MLLHLSKTTISPVPGSPYQLLSSYSQKDYTQRLEFYQTVKLWDVEEIALSLFTLVELPICIVQFFLVQPKYPLVH